MKTLLLSTLWLLFTLCVCVALLVWSGPRTGMPVTNDDFILIYDDGLHDVYRFVDRQMGVVCWVYDGFKAGGISCIPLAHIGS